MLLVAKRLQFLRQFDFVSMWAKVSVVQFDAVRLFAVGLRQVYANKPASIDKHRTNIEREIIPVSNDLCLKIDKTWVQRLDFYKRARGGHAKENEFHS